MKEKARNLAILWQHNFSNRDRSFMYCAKWEIIFHKIARKYDLIDEFIENGIIIF